jgi:hypothetical protein
VQLCGLRKLHGLLQHFRYLNANVLSHPKPFDPITCTGTVDGGGGGTLEGIRILGGRYGVRGGGTNWMFRTLRVENATKAGLLLNSGSWNNVFLDVHVSGSPVAVNLSQHNNNVVMLDSIFEIPAGGTGLNLYDMNSNETGIAISRVTAQGGDYAVRGPTAATSVRQAACESEWSTTPRPVSSPSLLLARSHSVCVMLSCSWLDTPCCVAEWWLRVRRRSGAAKQRRRGFELRKANYHARR